eukprot:jgi/Picsp_1/1105/NSC_04588-R1_oxysterol binding family protein
MSLLKRALFAQSSAVEEDVVVDEEGDEYYDALEAQLHPDACADGGIRCTDTQVMDRQKKAVVDIMKSLGKKLLTGKFDLLKISLPVKIFEPRSYLQKLGDPLVFPDLMMKAVNAKNPVERLKWVVTYFVAGYHRAFLTWSKPFNPIIGETWQASLSDGTCVYMEQISHHPPVSAVQIIGPKHCFYFHGHAQPSVTYKTNAITSYAHGERQLEFLDGTVIDITFPEYNIKSLVSSSPTKADLSGEVVFIDTTHGLKVELHFGKIEGCKGILARPDTIYGTMCRTKGHSNLLEEDRSRRLSKSLSRTGSWLGFNHPTPYHQPKSISSSRAFVLQDGGADASDQSKQGSDDLLKPLSICKGNWLAYLDWDDCRFWTLLEEKPDGWIPDPNPLPSDSSFREDLRKLATGSMDEAQIAKDQMETDQRRDAKLRIAT